MGATGCATFGTTFEKAGDVVRAVIMVRPELRRISASDFLGVARLEDVSNWSVKRIA